MVSCFVSEHCLFEKTILLSNIRATIHYIPFHPVIELSLEYSSAFGLVLFSSKFQYKSECSYDSYLEFLLGDEDEEELYVFA
jgi:hypothetical protein